MCRTTIPILIVLVEVGLVFQAAAGEPAVGPARIQLDHQDATGELRVMIDGQEAIVYQYGPKNDMAHYYPVRSPSGKPMTVQKTDPYPHHRSFWFADKVTLAGHRTVGFYSALYSKADKNDPNSPFTDRIRHVEFVKEEVRESTATVDAKLVWEMDLGKTPVLDELRRMRITALGQGEYFLDLTFTLTAAYGDVSFVSDWVHYAWPYIRMNRQFNVQDGGGTITSSEGGVNQKETNGKPARWMDYSCTVEGTTEGLAVFSHPSNGYPHKWLTRDYGTFGPRRVDAKSGKPFTLKKGEKLEQRIGVLVHRGDVVGGKVAERYQEYVSGDLACP